AALEQSELQALYKTADLCQLDVLVEVHTREELDRAIDLGATLIGVNNRNLTTFEVDLATTEELSEDVPNGITLVSESGLKTNADTRRVHAAGCQAILVGESLMRTGDIAGQVKELLNVE
ncbi:MAG TPA: indole-3-glycerol-phosphate synthase TrpC, partial [Chthoniobacter sp.]|nr:indole-3-glycerol-phosphate synthase TrpC [Chthoniobacter sp.]